MCDWLLAGACVVGVARDCSDPRCGGNRVCSTECRKKREMGGLQHPDISYLFCLTCFPPSGLSFRIVNLVILLLP